METDEAAATAPEAGDQSPMILLSLGMCPSSVSSVFETSDAVVKTPSPPPPPPPQACAC